MKRALLIILKAAVFILAAAVCVWFFPIMLSEMASGRWDRHELQKRNNEYWFRRHGFDQWFGQFEKQQHKKRRKKWKKRNNFYKQ